VTDAQSFVDRRSKVWNGRDSDPQLYMELLHEGCPLINPVNPSDCGRSKVTVRLSD
jgi:hypothetical protein